MDNTLRSRSYGSTEKQYMTSTPASGITVDHENALHVSVPRLKTWSELRKSPVMIGHGTCMADRPCSQRLGSSMSNQTHGCPAITNICSREGNHFIETGYRPACASLWDCYKSWSYLHNESVNIWSHIIGAALFIVLPIWIFTTEVPPRYAVATTADLFVCILYFIGVAICFMLSVT